MGKRPRGAKFKGGKLRGILKSRYVSRRVMYFGEAGARVYWAIAHLTLCQ